MEYSQEKSNIVPEANVFSLSTEYHYLLHLPPAEHELLFIALHGYGMSAGTMLDLSLSLLGRRHAIASIQAPNQFYLQDKPGGDRIGYNWGTRNHGTANIQLHHAMIRAVRRELEGRLGIPAARTVLVGYSQPVGFNYRFSAAFPEESRGVIGLCGGVPKDWETGPYGPVSASLLHIAREQDEFFPPEVTTDYARKLRTRADDVEFHLLPGGHRFPSQGRTLVEPWLNRLFPALIR